MALKYKVGDKVRIKNLDWYNENKNKRGEISVGNYEYNRCMRDYCGKVMTIHRIVDNRLYVMKETYIYTPWTDEMIEGLVEEETLIERVDDNGLPFNEWLSHKGAFYIPDGYELKDENGNVINATKIVLEEKSPKTDDITEMIEMTNMKRNACQKCAFAVYDDNPHCGLRGFTSNFNVEWCSAENDKAPNGYELQEDGYFSWVEKKKEYPKTYEECCKILGIDPDNYLTIRNVHCYDGEEETTDYERDLLGKFDSLWELRICRDAYWKIAGEEMGLGKPWEPDFDNENEYKYGVFRLRNIIYKDATCIIPTLLIFPTLEMRDAFYENFKELIEICKELL